MDKLKCTKCGRSKPTTEFQRAPRNTKRGYASWCKACARGASRDYKKRVPQKTDAAYARAYNRRKRQEVLAALGGVCVRCGVDDARVLQVDHVNGDGGIERQAWSSYTVLRRILAGEPGYQLLCANCHSIKTFENGEHRARV